MTDTDKPTIHASLKDLDQEVRPAPFTYMTKANKRVVFPDPGEMGWEESDQFSRDLNSSMPAREFLIKYLGEKDFTALEAEKFNGYQMTNFMTLVLKHYKAFLGTPGEEGASRG